MITYRREKRPGVPAGESAQCESCGRSAAYLVNSLLWQLKEHDICPDCVDVALMATPRGDRGVLADALGSKVVKDILNQRAKVRPSIEPDA